VDLPAIYSRLDATHTILMEHMDQLGISFSRENLHKTIDLPASYGVSGSCFFHPSLKLYPTTPGNHKYI
jgi:hypothetical protein